MIAAELRQLVAEWPDSAVVVFEWPGYSEDAKDCPPGLAPQATVKSVKMWRPVLGKDLRSEPERYQIELTSALRGES